MTAVPEGMFRYPLKCMENGSVEKRGSEGSHLRDTYHSFLWQHNMSQKAVFPVPRPKLTKEPY